MGERPHPGRSGNCAFEEEPRAAPSHRHSYLQRGPDDAGTRACSCDRRHSTRRPLVSRVALVRSVTPGKPRRSDGRPIECITEVVMTSAPGLSMMTRKGSVAAGLAGGLVGGIAFGLLMQMMGMMPMVAMLVRSESVFVGWLVHLVIASAIGISFALLFGAWARTLAVAAAIGLGY